MLVVAWDHKAEKNRQESRSDDVTCVWAAGRTICGRIFGSAISLPPS